MERLPKHRAESTKKKMPLKCESAQPPAIVGAGGASSKKVRNRCRAGIDVVVLVSIYDNQEALEAVTSEKAFLALLGFMKS
jgi:hypothetical protein